LRSLLEQIGINARDVFITSAVKYLPKNYITPKQVDITHGRKHLFKQLEIIQPKVIVLLGSIAAQAVLEEKFSISKSHGTTIRRDGLIYFLSYHPAAPLYSPKLLEIITKDFKKLKNLYNEYLLLSNSDKKIAMSFLKKAYNVSDEAETFINKI
jgi:DNA polymerase